MVSEATYLDGRNFSLLNETLTTSGGTLVEKGCYRQHTKQPFGNVDDEWSVHLPKLSERASPDYNRKDTANLISYPSIILMLSN